MNTTFPASPSLFGRESGSETNGMLIHTSIFLQLRMLGKPKGQVLRLAAALHVVFCDTVDGRDIAVSQIPPTISKDAIIAAQNFVDTCCQHAALIAGRGRVEDEISQLSSAGKFQ